MTMADLIIEQFKAETAQLDLEDEMGVVDNTYQAVPLFLKNMSTDAFAFAAAADPDIEDEAARRSGSFDERPRSRRSGSFDERPRIRRSGSFDERPRFRRSGSFDERPASWSGSCDEHPASGARTAASARARVRAVFDLLVREGTSGLSADDLTTAFARLDIKLSAAKTRWMMEKMDVDGDGTIGFDEVVGPRVSSDDDVA